MIDEPITSKIELPAAEYARISELWSVIATPNRVIANFNMEGKKAVKAKEQLGKELEEMEAQTGLTREKLLEKLYAQLGAEALTDLQAILTNDYFATYFDRFKAMEPPYDKADLEGIAYDSEQMDALRNAYQRLHRLEFKRGYTMSYPFCEIDTDTASKNWKRMVKIAQDFGHSFSGLIDVQGLMGITELLLDEKGGDKNPHYYQIIKQIAETIPLISYILEAYKEQLLREDQRSTTNLSDVMHDDRQLVDFRYDHTPMKKGIQEMPMEVHAKQQGVSIQNSSPAQLRQAFYELLRNCFGWGKTSNETLREFEEKGEPYAQINVLGQTEIKGCPVALVEIRDKGTQMSIQALREALEIGDYALRDIPVGVLFNAILKRGVSLKKAHNEANLGYGVDIAYQIIREHNGTMIYSNLREGGVGCLVAIPIQGKASRINLSEEGITGHECDEIIGQLSGAAQADPHLAERLQSYAEADRETHAILNEVGYIQACFRDGVHDWAATSTPPSGPPSGSLPAHL